MDDVEKKLTLTVEKFGKRWTFHRPTARQLVQADTLAAQMRGNIPANSLIYSVTVNVAIAFLNTTVTDPKGYDFGALYDDEVNAVYEEVLEWINSFRPSVSAEQGTVGTEL